MGATIYAERIDNILTSLFNARYSILQANRSSLDRYLECVWLQATELTQALCRVNLPKSIAARFQPFLEEEEERLRGNLQGVEYMIDDPDTLSLVTGGGKIEKV